MTKLKNYLSVSILKATMGVLVVLLSLDAIAELIDQMDDIAGDYTLLEVLIYTALKLPASVVDYLALAALIGSLVGLGALASSSELVVMRSAGMSVRQLVWAVMRAMLGLILLSALMAEFVVPYASQVAESRRSLALGRSDNASLEGVWNREGNEYMHFGAVLPNGKLFGVSRYVFDGQGRLIDTSFTESAIYQGGYWFEQNGVGTRFDRASRPERYSFATRRWETELSPDLLDILTLDPGRLPIKRLVNYAEYLGRQSLDAGEYWLAFWHKVLQPLSTLSLVMIAISFILGPLRQVPVGYRVFVGVLVGLGFQTAQRLLGPSSMIWGFPPYLAVLLPIMVCFVIGMVLIKRSE